MASSTTGASSPTPMAQPSTSSQAPTPSLLTGISLGYHSSVDAEKIVNRLRARLGFASLKAANGLTLHTLADIERATAEAERLELLLLEQQSRFVASARGANETTAPSISDTNTPSRRSAASVWTSPSSAMAAVASTSNSHGSRPRQKPAQTPNRPRTIFDAMAARGTVQHMTSSHLLFPRMPSTSKTGFSSRSASDRVESSSEASNATASQETSKPVLTAATLLHRAASIPQLGSPRRLVNMTSDLNDPHNHPTAETQQAERSLATAFMQRQRQEQQRLSAKEHQRQALNAQQPGGSKKNHGQSALAGPPAKRARFSKQAEVVVVEPAGNPSWPSASSNAAAAILAARSPSSKLASSYARGVAASSAIGTSLARSPDIRSTRPNSATANASSLTFQSPRGLTLGQGLGITSRTTLNAGSTHLASPSKRNREESFERGGSVIPASPLRLGDSPVIHASRPTPPRSSMTPAQRTRPLLSPPPSSPAAKEGVTPPRRAHEDFVRRTLSGASSGRSHPSPLSSPARDARSPVRMAASSRGHRPGSSGTSHASLSPAQGTGTTSQSTTASGSFGLGFNFEQGPSVAMAAPATPKSKAMRALAEDGAGKTTQNMSIDSGVDLDGSEAAQLMLFLAGSPSAPSSTRFTAGVTPSVTNLPFDAPDMGEKGSSRGQASASRAQSQSGANTALVGVGPGSGSPGPEINMVARMLTYGSVPPRHPSGHETLSPRTSSTASTPELGLCPAETSSGGSSAAVSSQPSDGDLDSEKQAAASISGDTTPEPFESKAGGRLTLEKGTPPRGSGATGADRGSVARPATPPRQPPSTPKAPGSSTFSYAEFLNVSPSPRPRRTPLLGGAGKSMSRTGSGDRLPADPSRTPSRGSRSSGRFLDFDQELGPQSATIEQRKRFAAMLQIGEEDDDGGAAGAHASLTPGFEGSARSDRLLSLGNAFSFGQTPTGTPLPGTALKEKSHNHSSGLLDPTAVRRSRMWGGGVMSSGGGGAGRMGGSMGDLHDRLNASPVLKPQVARPLAGADAVVAEPLNARGAAATAPSR